jgi:cell division protein FtsQ
MIPLPRPARSGAIALAAAMVLSAPWWGGQVLGALAFFRVRSVEIQGARYAAPADIADRLRLDTTMSVWTDLRVLDARVRGLPGIRTVDVSRKLPGTIVVAIQEQEPVALVPTAAGLRPYDVHGTALPFDPVRVDLDLPVLARLDRRALRLLADLRHRAPALYAGITNVRVDARGDLVVVTPTFTVRASPDADAARLAAAVPVAEDLARRHIAAIELDVRFRDQVVVRRA